VVTLDRSFAALLETTVVNAETADWSLANWSAISFSVSKAAGAAPTTAEIEASICGWMFAPVKAGEPLMYTPEVLISTA
jgi:hypothetical protein